MNKEELVKKLRDTAHEMAVTAECLAFYGSLAEAVKHAAELLGASEMVVQWADELNKEPAK